MISDGHTCHLDSEEPFTKKAAVVAWATMHSYTIKYCTAHTGEKSFSSATVPHTKHREAYC